MRASAYKLGAYKLIESDTGEIRWEGHFGLGGRQGGNCFKKGGILFVGPAEHVRPGFLKGEFLDRLDALPAWGKTRYYCKGLDIYRCESGRKVAREEMLRWRLERGTAAGGGREGRSSAKASPGSPAGEAAGGGVFRLQRFEITAKADGRVTWRRPTGPDTVGGGQGVALEDILFIDAQQNEQPNSNRRKFWAHLKELPPWERTTYYSPKLVVHACGFGGGPQKEGQPPSDGRAVTQPPAPRGRHRPAARRFAGFAALKRVPWKHGAAVLGRQAGVAVFLWVRWTAKGLALVFALSFAILSATLHGLAFCWKKLDALRRSRKAKKVPLPPENV